MAHGYVCSTHASTKLVNITCLFSVMCYHSCFLGLSMSLGAAGFHPRPAMVVSLEPPAGFVQVEAPAMNDELDPDLPGYLLSTLTGQSSAAERPGSSLHHLARIITSTAQQTKTKEKGSDDEKAPSLLRLAGLLQHTAPLAAPIATEIQATCGFPR